ncbi:phosphatidate phosphatase PAH2-like isoform X2 [Impatiens glandulifera]|uniref:phosphatidate phosphatase PAH2-like isoform X2 n=1 Tax=Impatiens glandulifera TaxID=253017 RepID=UPI001FB110AD|nr:phosphatidate phosphatase PAH2-like isoform X2 [Impatiens glandulifera]
MYAVGRIGSYISRGVYTVSGPFHPFGGAVDIIVIQQKDGSFKSSPWYVRFGKFQGVLKAREKVVKINVNGVDKDFHMHLDHKGEAYFMREVESDELDSVSFISSSGDDTDCQSPDIRRPMKSKSCNFDAVTQVDVSNGKILSRTNSRRSRILGFVLGRRSMKGERPPRPLDDDDRSSGVVRTESWDRAEIAADLLEVRWSTNIGPPKHRKDDPSRLSASDESALEKDNDEKMSDVSPFAFKKMSTSDEQSGIEMRSLSSESVNEIDQNPIISCSYEEMNIHKRDDESAPSIVAETYTQVVTVDPLDGSVKEIEAHRICAISDDLNNSSSVSDDSEDSEEEQPQLVFGDVDDLTDCEVKKNTESSVSTTSCADYDESNCDNNTMVGCSRIDFPGSGKLAVGERRIAESLPNIQYIQQKKHVLGCSLDSNAGPQIWKELKEDVMDNVEADNIKQLHVGLAANAEFPDENQNVQFNPKVGDGNSTKPIDSTGGNWRGWPFPFRRVNNGKTSESVQSLSEVSNGEESVESSSNVDGGKDSSKLLKEKMKKNNKKKNKKQKKMKELTPTSEQLVSLNLKEGSNTVTFTFSTSMLGPQQVQARIYLWKWDTRIVISDVDGTITKSDVLGQFMPLVGIDWSQTGVTHLFSAIKENGYQLLFLSARAISQAHITKQFLLNLKQDGKALPEGPVIISPDGLFPSLFREVIRRAPHEFKIACLEDIKALFPPDHNPFYAGFGNRDTDEISYLKVGIPIGKIFIINPKGEVVVNRQVDTKSYTSIHVLVHDMFPPPSSLPEQEDFNSWNFWKLPPPVIR